MRTLILISLFFSSEALARDCVTFRAQMAEFMKTEKATTTNIIKRFGLPDEIRIDHEHNGYIAFIWKSGNTWRTNTWDVFDSKKLTSDICLSTLAKGHVRDVKWD